MRASTTSHRICARDTRNNRGSVKYNPIVIGKKTQLITQSRHKSIRNADFAHIDQNPTHLLSFAPLSQATSARFFVFVVASGRRCIARLTGTYPVDGRRRKTTAATTPLLQSSQMGSWDATKVPEHSHPTPYMGSGDA